MPAIFALALLVARVSIAGTIEFEVASVRPAPVRLGTARFPIIRGGPGTPDPGQAVFQNVSLLELLTKAYEVSQFQIAVPLWLRDARFDVVAKVPPGTSPSDFRLMLKALLQERFHLSLHGETKDVPGYELHIGKGESKLNVSHDNEMSVNEDPEPERKMARKKDANGFVVLDRPGFMVYSGRDAAGPVTRITAKEQPVSALVRELSGQLQRPVVDKTGLSAKYNFTLVFVPELVHVPSEQTGPGQSAADIAAPVPNLLSALETQLGLRLVPLKLPFEMLTIDHADRIPTEN